MEGSMIGFSGRFGDAVTASALTLSTCVEADMAAERLCSIEGCNKPHRGYGLCNMHYQRLKSGYPMSAPPFTTQEQVDGFYEMALASETDDCILWPFSCNAAGYAVRRRGAGSHMVSRQLCEAIHGAPKPDMVAAHSCGKGHTGCVNPRHIRWATTLENVHDKYIHGTVIWGEKNHQSKLTDAYVVEILAALDSGEFQRSIARRYGVQQTTISDIARGRSWQHINHRSPS